MSMPKCFHVRSAFPYLASIVEYIVLIANVIKSWFNLMKKNFLDLITFVGQLTNNFSFNDQPFVQILFPTLLLIFCKIALHYWDTNANIKSISEFELVPIIIHSKKHESKLLLNQKNNFVNFLFSTSM